MSLVDLDILQSSRPIIFILNSKNGLKTMGVYTDLSTALQSLYLADETAIIFANYVNYTCKPCINDTYDCQIGKFYFKNDNLIYCRNLTGEIQQIDEDNGIFLKSDHFLLVKNELEKIENEEKKRTVNEYHKKAHNIVDLKITEKFNKLSSLLINKFNKKLSYYNDLYNMNFDYDLTFEINKFYQESNEKLGFSSLEEKLSIIKKINLLISKINDELIILKELQIELEDISEELECSSDDSELLNIRSYHLSERNKNKTNTSSVNHSIIYGSPPSSPKKLTPPKIETKKIKDPNQVKKTVSFDLNLTTIHEYQQPIITNNIKQS